MKEFHDESEHAITPARVIVHDPTLYDAFDGSRARTEGPAAVLFREEPDAARLADQHARFVSLLEEYVPVVRLGDLVPPEHRNHAVHSFETNPNFLFTHDALITLPWAPEIWIRGAMREPVRRAETAVVEMVATALALREIVIEGGGYLEGGDVIPLMTAGRGAEPAATRTLLVGHGPRTSAASIPALYRALSAAGLADEVIGIELAPWRLNLDGCLFPVSRDLIVLHRGSILGGVRADRNGAAAVDPVAYLSDRGFRLIEAGREESFDNQACNFFCAGNDTLIAYGMTERINDELRAAGLTVRSFDGSELVKGNGGPHCMTRPLYSGRRS